jgi:hypothetical protein
MNPILEPQRFNEILEAETARSGKAKAEAIAGTAIFLALLNMGARDEPTGKALSWSFFRTLTTLRPDWTEADFNHIAIYINALMADYKDFDK